MITQAHQKLSQTHQLAEEVNGLRQELIRASNLIKEENQKAQFAKNMADNLMNELNMANNQLQEARLAPNMQQAYETQIQALQQELNVFLLNYIVV